MWPILALIENIICIALWAGTLFLLALMCKRKSPRMLWRKSPPLAAVFLSCALLAVSSIFMLIPFTLRSSGLVELNIQQVHITLVTGLAVIQIRSLYDLCTISLFAQRVYIISFPSLDCRKFGKCLIYASLGISAVLVGSDVVVYRKQGLFDDRLIPQGCYALSCTEQIRTSQSWTSATRFVLSFAIVLLGCAFLVVHRCKRLFIGPTVEFKFFVLMRYWFISRLVLEAIPFTIEVFLRKVADISLSYYIGSYGSVGCAIDGFMCTVLYYFILSGKH